MAYPTEFTYLKSFAEKCDLVGNDDDCKRFVAQLDHTELQEYIALYLDLVNQGAKPRLDDWLDNLDEVTHDGSQAMRLLTLLDYLARHDYIPKPQSEIRFIEWDEREFDDYGNEW